MYNKLTCAMVAGYRNEWRFYFKSDAIWNPSYESNNNNTFTVYNALQYYNNNTLVGFSQCCHTFVSLSFTAFLTHLLHCIPLSLSVLCIQATSLPKNAGMRDTNLTNPE